MARLAAASLDVARRISNLCRNGVLLGAENGSIQTPKRYPDEALDPGDVVGLTDGHVSKETGDAEHAMVVSTSPIVLGGLLLVGVALWQRRGRDGTQ